MSLLVVAIGWSFCKCSRRDNWISIDGGTFVHESVLYALPSIVKSADPVMIRNHVDTFRRRYHCLC